ncbi:hypothetical protein BH10PAT3_BH10PAT3_6560 [soil metagenome]
MLLALSKKRSLRQDSYVRPLLPALLVFMALLVMIGVSWRTARQDIHIQQQSIVNQNAAFVEGAIMQRFSAYEDSLRAANALFLGSEDVTRDEWSSFVGSLDLPSRYPGIRGLGFIKLVNSDEKEAFQENVRSNDLGNYAIYPASQKDIYAPLLYIVPLGSTTSTERNSPALGFDMYTDPIRANAMKVAAETGKPALSGVLDLIQANRNPPSKGFLMFMPYYKKGVSITTPIERRAAIDGYFYEPFITNSTFAPLFNLPNNLAFAIYDGASTSSSSILYQSTLDYENASYVQAKITKIALYGQRWNVIYKIRKEIVPATVRNRPASVLIGGTIFAASLALIIYLLIQRRTRALSYFEQKKLEEAKDELLSLASHQLRTPATAVKQYVSMVKDGFAGSVTAEQRKLLEMAYESNERQLTIVDDLLYVARIDAGQAVIRPEAINLNKMIDSVIEDQLSMINSRNQIVNFKKPRQVQTVSGDPQYLRMIFENLLSNASKYSYEGKRIAVALRSAEEQIIIDFTDNGVGIKAEDFSNVFLKFNRIPNELTRQIAGSGIGLYLAKQLALLHGGDITFTSKPGKGSTFSVILPKHDFKKKM